MPLINVKKRQINQSKKGNYESPQEKMTNLINESLHFTLQASIKDQIHDKFFNSIEKTKFKKKIKNLSICELEALHVILN